MNGYWVGSLYIPPAYRADLDANGDGVLNSVYLVALNRNQYWPPF